MYIKSDADEANQEAVEKEDTFSPNFFWFLILGFALVFMGIAVILIAAVLYGGGSASVGAVIFIGPFPIVVGAGPDVTWIVLLSIIIAVLSIMVFLIMNRRIRKLEG